MRIPFEIPAKSMKNHDITGSEVFGFVHFKEHVENNTVNRMEKTMKQSSALKGNMTKKGKLRKGIGILLAVCMAIAIGKDLILSPPFPLLYTVRETFASYGVPSYICKLFIV